MYRQTHFHSKVWSKKYIIYIYILFIYYNTFIQQGFITLIKSDIYNVMLNVFQTNAFNFEQKY